MSQVFNTETIVYSSQQQDRGRLAELNKHQLLKTENAEAQIATFDQVRDLGKWYLQASRGFKTVLPSTKSLPDGLLRQHELRGNQVFMGKLALGVSLDTHFPVTIQPIVTEAGRDLLVHIVPIHFGALELAQFGSHTDELLALAAAAAAAPHFILALQDGISTECCSSKKPLVTSITPDHGTPLAVAFDAFADRSATLNNAIAVTNNPALTIRQAAHLHGEPKPSVTQIATAAAGSKIAAGVPIRSVLRSRLPRHALYYPQMIDPISGQPIIVSLKESLLGQVFSSNDFAFLAAALGFTAQVVGESPREQSIEKVLTSTNADMPLQELTWQ